LVRKKWLILGVTALLVMVTGALSRAAAPDPDVSKFLKDLYSLRARALMTGESARGLDSYYDLSAQTGRNALAHEGGRISYMQAWAPARRLQVTTAAAEVTNLRVKVSGSTATVSAIVRTQLGYKYEGVRGGNEMGIGSWHWLELTRQDGAWRVVKEFYLDALGDEWTEPFAPAGIGPVSPAAQAQDAPVLRTRLDRKGMVAYAETYCGAAWGCGNRANYNERFRSYRNLGGDCANFASQVLSEGGKLKPDWIWRHDKEGSACWVNAQSFVRYLTGGGRATLLARGTWSRVAPALGQLKPGDIIGYQSKGTVTHVSVVTGNDSAGTPVVAAHTADRFRNPWDLGWDKDTVYWLVHLRD
jgi:hypothetical protein